MIVDHVLGQLGLLVESWERGATAYEFTTRLFQDHNDKRRFSRALRSCRILESHGYVSEIRALQIGYKAYRVTPSGVARWDRHQLG